MRYVNLPLENPPKDVVIVYEGNSIGICWLIRFPAGIYVVALDVSNKRNRRSRGKSQSF